MLLAVDGGFGCEEVERGVYAIERIGERGLRPLLAGSDLYRGGQRCLSLHGELRHGSIG
jgi:hypothetical protein